MPVIDRGISGLVVKSVVAKIPEFDGPRVRFTADAFICENKHVHYMRFDFFAFAIFSIITCALPNFQRASRVVS